MSGRIVAVGLLAVAILGAAGFVGYRWLATPEASAMICSLTVEYEALPPDDAAFAEWLRGRPGLRSEEVTRDGPRLSARFEVVAPHDPDPIGDAVRRLDALGYASRVGYAGRFGRRRAFDFQTLRVEFDRLPADDSGLGSWLKANPALSRTSVAREGKVVSIEYASTDSAAPTIVGDVFRACESLGYDTRRGYVSGFGPYR